MQHYLSLGIEQCRIVDMPTPSSAPSPNSDLVFPEVVRYLFVVFVIGALVATVFTMWTPASILPSSTTRDIAIAMATRVSSGATAVVPAATPTSSERVGLVAGHSENDSGAVCPDGLTEVKINLDIASQVKVKLEELGLTVDLLAEFDPDLSGYSADALVSIHADSCDYINDVATGYKVTGSLESKIPEESNRLASCLIDRYAKRTDMQFHAGSITYDMEYYHIYSEIAADTPAAIIEVGFMNLDRDILVNRSDVVAQGVTDGILCFVHREPLGGV